MAAFASFTLSLFATVGHRLLEFLVLKHLVNLCNSSLSNHHFVRLAGNLIFVRVPRQFEVSEQAKIGKFSGTTA